MSLNNKLCVASHNAGKLLEYSNILDGLNIEVISAIDISLPDIDETANTFRGNAALKAKAGLAATNLPTIGDDSGLCVEALDGKPGIYSARWGGPARDFAIAAKRIKEELADSENRKAYFITVLALALPNGSIEYFEGYAHGSVSFPARGNDGFGYDPIFIPDGHDITYAEMGQLEKNTISSRFIALQKLLNYYQAAA